MELSQLEVFLSVAREAGLARAAEKLRTQSGGEPDIQSLKTNWGKACLTVRSREGVLTDAGQVL